MDITKLSEMELKSMWYDQLTQKEQAEANMRAINEQIMKLRQATQDIPVTEEVASTEEEAVQE